MRLSFSTVLPFLVAAASLMSGCAAIEGIFKAGFWVGIIIVVLVGGLAAAMLGMFRR
jgi:hypothetical protein